MENRIAILSLQCFGEREVHGKIQGPVGILTQVLLISGQTPIHNTITVKRIAFSTTIRSLQSGIQDEEKACTATSTVLVNIISSHALTYM